MDSKSKVIIEKQMTISEIEKKWNCNTDRAVKLFCKALGLKKPNTDKLEAWSKHKLRHCKGYADGGNRECEEHKGTCNSCRSCQGSCSC